MPWGVESQAAPGRDPGGTALPSSNKPIPEADGASTALVVLGTHRSGTSALANVLAAAGADPGERLVPGSPGNETGHWEDAFAVETNQRLLAALGHRLDDVRPLPAGWQEAGPATEARHRIVQYVCGSRLAHPLWTNQDPRTGLPCDLWISALSEAGCSRSEEHTSELQSLMRISYAV